MACVRAAPLAEARRFFRMEEEDGWHRSGRWRGCNRENVRRIRRNARRPGESHSIAAAGPSSGRRNSAAVPRWRRPACGRWKCDRIRTAIAASTVWRTASRSRCSSARRRLVSSTAELRCGLFILQRLQLVGAGLMQHSSAATSSASVSMRLANSSSSMRSISCLQNAI